ncbi:MAG: hypothetical protein V3T31_11920 [candidate division Zixibacteria bacterium]
MKRLICLLLLPLVWLACSETAQQKRDDLIAKGNRQISNYEFDQAESTFYELLAIDTISFAGPEGLALGLERQLLHWDALHFYMKISIRNPRSIPAALGAMRIYKRLGLYEAALERASIADNLAGTDGAITAELASICLTLQKPSLGRTLADQAAKNGMASSIRDILTAHAMFEEAKFDSAEALCSQALASGESSPLFFRLAADFFEASGRFDSAMVISAQATASDDSGFDELMEHFYRTIRLGYFDEARRLVRLVQKDGQGTSLEYTMDFLTTASSGRSQLAMVPVARLLLIRPDYLSPKLQKIEGYRMTGDQVVAIADLTWVRSKITRGGYEESFVKFMVHQFVDILIGQNDALPALNDHRKTHEAAVSQMEYNLKEAWLLSRTGQYDAYEAKFDTLKRTYADNIDWLVGLGNLCGDSMIKQIPRAEDFFSRALAIDKWRRDAFEGYLEMYRKEKDWPKALRLFKAYRHFPRVYPDLAVKRAIYLTWAGQFAEGIAALKESIGPLSGQTKQYRTMLRALWRYQRFDEIREVIDLLLTLQPNNSESYVLASHFLAQIGDHTASLEAAEKGLAIYKESMDLGGLKAWNLYNLGRTEEAFPLFEEIVSEPESPGIVRLYYSRALAMAGTNPRRAENMARTAVTSGIDQLMSRTNLCYVYMLVGRPDLVRAESKKALRAFPEYPEPHYYLGYARFLDKVEGARESLEKAVALGLVGEDLTRAKQAISEL